MPLATLGVHIAVGFGLFALGFGLFSAGLFGGGDAKLLAAAGLWLGLPDLMPFLVMTVFAGGALALAVMAWSVISLDSEIKEGSLFKYFGGLKPQVPYGFALASGAILAFPQSWWMPVVS
jgi:prepilin peptidase CpaA